MGTSRGLHTVFRGTLGGSAETPQKTAMAGEERAGGAPTAPAARARLSSVAWGTSVPESVCRPAVERERDRENRKEGVEDHA